MASEISIPPHWRSRPLEEVMDAIIDYRGKSPRKTRSGIPLVTAKIVKNGRILPPDEFIAVEDYEEWMRRGLPLPGDVLLTTEAPLGEVAQLDDRKVALAQRLIALRGKANVLDNTYLKFLLQSQPIQEGLRARSTGTTVAGISQGELRKIMLPIPPIEEQRAVANVLGTLDATMALNREISGTLEILMRAIFRSWFVDFDPVRARSEARDVELPSPLVEMFPKAFVPCILGEMPEGWQVGTFGDVATNPRRGISPEEISDGTPYIALDQMPRKSISLSEWKHASGLESGKFQFKKGEILFGKLRPYFHKVGVAPVDGVCSTDILVIKPSTLDWFGFALGHASSDAFVENTNASSTGTKMPRTNWNDMASFQVVLPPPELAKAYNNLVLPIVTRITSAIHKNHTLAAMRNALIPNLLSGQIRIQDAVRIVRGLG
jgi:type I restriction enzyme S subunit